MATRTARSERRDSVAGVIGASTRVRGKVSGDGSLVVRGTLEGDVTIRGDFTVTDGARAVSDVEAEAVTVEGELEGDIRATGAVVLGARARVRGDIRGSEVSIEEGAQLSGRLDAEFDLPPELGGGGGGRRR